MPQSPLTGQFNRKAVPDLFEHLSVNSLNRDLSNATTFNPPLFSLANTFNVGGGGAMKF